MDSFREVVETLGGALVDVQLPVYDSRYGTDDGRGTLKLYIPPGVHHWTAGRRSRMPARGTPAATSTGRRASSAPSRPSATSWTSRPSSSPVASTRTCDMVAQERAHRHPAQAVARQLAELAQTVDLDERDLAAARSVHPTL